MLRKYLHHLVRAAKESATPGNPYSVMLLDQFCNLTWKEFRAWRLDDSNQGTRSASSTGHRGYTQQDSRHKTNQNAFQLLVFKKSIKMEVSQNTVLKDEKYFEASKRNLLVTNRSLTPKHTNSVGLRLETNLSLLWMLSWEISIKHQQKMHFKRLKILNNQPKIG